MNTKWVGASENNYEKGRRGKTVELLVVHWIVGPLSAADAVFNNPDKQVSSHYGIGGNEIHQYVKEEDTAYHAGVFDVNLRSIGIEHEGGPNLPISNATYNTSAQLICELAKKYNIPLDRDHIKGHREFKATACPGTLDIDRLIREAKKNDPLDMCLQQHEQLVTKLDLIDEFRKKISNALIHSEGADWQRIHDEVNRLVDEEKDLIDQASVGDRLWNAIVEETGVQGVKYTTEGENTLVTALKGLKQVVPEGSRLITQKEYDRLVARKTLDRFTAMELFFEILRRVGRK